MKKKQKRKTYYKNSKKKKIYIKIAKLCREQKKGADLV